MLFEQISLAGGASSPRCTDNGHPFASTAIAGLSQLSVWWISLGILPELIEPGEPQQNGRHERMHRTLKERTASPPREPPRSTAAVQRLPSSLYREVRSSPLALHALARHMRGPLLISPAGTMTVRAAVMEQFGEPLKVHENWADPECGSRDVILNVKACGICRSDHTIWEGGAPWVGLVPELPSVLGHEYCGTVEEVGREVTGFEKGDRVVAPFNHACGTCGFCTSGHQNVCANVQVPSMHYTGAYAGYAGAS